ncbi:MAG: PQQ-binding-like beta-propeller repeat protein [Deltaproteobacteria bacterium]|nr:PQQ-binding-like beta-propeller repeat protein [Deltaproteobacteria bacterium]
MSSRWQEGVEIRGSGTARGRMARAGRARLGSLLVLALAGCGSWSPPCDPDPEVQVGVMPPGARAENAPPTAGSTMSVSTSRPATSSAVLAAPTSPTAIPGSAAPASSAPTAGDAANAGSTAVEARLANARPIELAEPPFAAYVRAGLTPVGGAPPRFKKLSVRPNKVTDDAEWFERNELTPPGFRGSSEDAPNPPPAGIPAKVGTDYTLWGQTGSDRNALVLGPNWLGGTSVAIVGAPDEAVVKFDFSQWSGLSLAAAGQEQFAEQRVRWAEVHGDVLYVATGHPTYARSSGGKNAFVSALDRRTGELLWQSAPLVSNADNFLLIGDFIVTGYGFTAEPDALFALDRATGKTVARTPLPSGPSHLVLKDGTLYVRTYDRDLTFRFEPGRPKTK